MTSDVYQTIKQFFEDEMCNYIRLLFAIKLAELHEKHLVKFQAEKPMCPFLHEALVEVLRNLCKIILKPESVPFDHEGLQDLNLDNPELFLQVPNVGPSILELVDDLIPLAKKEIYQEITNCIKKELKHLLNRDKLGLGNKHFAALAALNPRNRCKEKFVVESIIMLGRSLSIDTDLLHEQAQLYLSSIRPLAFSETERLDCWFNDVFKLIEIIQPAPEFKVLVKKLLSIPYGQAFVERGFNLSKIKSDNRATLCQDTFRAEKIAKNALKHQGGSKNIKIDSKLLTSVKNARANYREDLKKKD